MQPLWTSSLLLARAQLCKRGQKSKKTKEAKKSKQKIQRWGEK
jgi:hypothetical protein